jgi:ParB family chromosome partitioning protein
VQLQELAASIGEVGILQPLTVKKSGEGYVVVSGNRRLLAARMAGLGEVPCLLLEEEGADGELIALTENLQREDLGYFQEAECLQAYLRHSGLTQAQAARRLGRSQSALANKLRLLQHSPRVREAAELAGLSERQARELLRVPGEEARLTVIGELSRRGLNVAQTQRYIDGYLQNLQRPPAGDTQRFLQRLQRETQSLQAAGISTSLRGQQEKDTLVVTVKIVQNAQEICQDSSVLPENFWA